MALDTHWKVRYSDTVKELAGHQMQSYLKETVDHDSKTGELVWFDTIQPQDAAVLTDLTNLAERHMMGFLGGVADFTEFKKILTRHMAVDKGRVYLSQFENEWSHHFRDMDEVAQNANEHSRVLKQGMKEIFKQQDTVILNALFAANTQQGKDVASLANVPFPATQIVDEADSVFDLQTITQINEKFDENFLEGEMKFCVIDPATKRQLLDNEANKINSSDFVSSREYFTQGGKLPEIHGIVFLVHPLVANYKGTYDNIAAAYTKDAVVYNQFAAMRTEIDQSPLTRFNYILQICEFINAVRCDDKKVVWIRLGTP